MISQVVLESSFELQTSSDAASVELPLSRERALTRLQIPLHQFPFLYSQTCIRLLPSFTHLYVGTIFNISNE